MSGYGYVPIKHYLLKQVARLWANLITSVLGKHFFSIYYTFSDHTIMFPLYLIVATRNTNHLNGKEPPLPTFCWQDLMYSNGASNLLSSWGWPWISDFSAATSQVRRLQVSPTTSDLTGRRDGTSVLCMLSKHWTNNYILALRTHKKCFFRHKSLIRLRNKSMLIK